MKENFLFAKSSEDCNKFSNMLKAKESAHCVTNVTAPEQGSLDEVTRRAPRGMTLSILSLAAVLAMGIIGESRAASSVSYDDDGRAIEIVAEDLTKMAISYDSGTASATVYTMYSGGYYYEDSGYSVQNLDDGKLGIFGEYGGYAVILDNKGRIIQDGWTSSNTSEAWSEKTLYTYDEETGEKASRTLHNCKYAGYNVFNCTESATQTYTNVIDGNMVKEYINNELVGVNNYTDAYVASKSANNCNINKTCTTCPDGKYLQGGECVSTCGASFRLNDGECDRIRYTPAEAAQYLKDTDNEIIMTFKVNR